MSVPWEQAFQVGGVGFGMVFILLIILAVVIRLTGLILNKISAENKVESGDKGKGE